MSDNKKWFKVWGSILVDPSMSGLTLSDMGRWVRLGAYISTSGERGKLKISSPANMFLLAMEVESLADAKMALKRLPNVSLIEGLDEYGSFIVLMRNWYKYQVDTTHSVRQKRARHKKRGEQEEKLTSKSTSTSVPFAARPAPLAGASATRENNGEKTWQQNTNKQLNELSPQVASPQEVKAILDKFRRDNPRGKV